MFFTTGVNAIAVLATAMRLGPAGAANEAAATSGSADAANDEVPRRRLGGDGGGWMMGDCEGLLPDGCTNPCVEGNQLKDFPYCVPPFGNGGNSCHYISCGSGVGQCNVLPVAAGTKWSVSEGRPVDGTCGDIGPSEPPPPPPQPQPPKSNDDCVPCDEAFGTGIPCSDPCTGSNIREFGYFYPLCTGEAGTEFSPDGSVCHYMQCDASLNCYVFRTAPGTVWRAQSGNMVISTSGQCSATAPVPAPTMPIPAPTRPIPAPTRPIPAPTRPIPEPTMGDKDDTCAIAGTGKVEHISPRNGFCDLSPDASRPCCAQKDPSLGSSCKSGNAGCDNCKKGRVEAEKCCGGLCAAGHICCKDGDEDDAPICCKPFDLSGSVGGARKPVCPPTSTPCAPSTFPPPRFVACPFGRVRGRRRRK